MRILQLPWKRCVMWQFISVDQSAEANLIWSCFLFHVARAVGDQNGTHGVGVQKACFCTAELEDGKFIEFYMLGRASVDDHDGRSHFFELDVSPEVQECLDTLTRHDLQNNCGEVTRKSRSYLRPFSLPSFRHLSNLETKLFQLASGSQRSARLRRRRYRQGSRFATCNMYYFQRIGSKVSHS